MKTLFILALAFVATAAQADGLYYQPIQISPPQIYGQDGKYLGNLSNNPYDPNSTSNPYGQYGSRYSPDSINNPYGVYGSKYSPLSPNNPYGQGVRVYGGQ